MCVLCVFVFKREREREKSEGEWGERGYKIYFLLKFITLQY